MKKSLTILLLIICTCMSNAQFMPPSAKVYTRQDSLRGSITPERAWWDLKYYHLSVKVDPSDSSIYGTNRVDYKVLKEAGTMQIDLQPPLNLIRAEQNGKALALRREGNVYWITLTEKQEPGQQYSLLLTYGGKPKVAARPPWDGGITWKKDNNGNPFIASACQGDGASLWWPCKDHMYDEPDSMLISVTVPSGLMDVSNGRLRSVVRNRKEKTTTYNWFVANPINNYGVNINIGDYVHFSEVFKGEKGDLDCDYYVLRDNLEKAKVHFKQAPMMLAAFEHWFGPYPFYEDGYKLVEAPYLGMEHQSSVTYGNGYQNGYLGRDQSGSGWGDKFDFIIIHESGHEWFANSITYEDIADMWIHESFINYSENLYVEYHYGKEAGAEYVLGTRKSIRNDRPVTGIYNVNFSGSADMYPKGGNMLHTLRHVIGDDQKWRDLLRGLNSEFYHQVVKGSQIEDYLSEKTGMNLKPFFDQYLRDVRIPVFEYYVSGTKLNFRWNNCVPGFNMPLRILISGEPVLINPSSRYTSFETGKTGVTVVVDPDYYVASMNISGK
ncbi:MAG TPA: M1 family metallopeptidase [Bacteroidales bacterium]|nr:M1 family metallopeptidase [Bacteroidales bacterium]HPJ59280.1 M1 family metallopeptidase [Bacteroidales bacterium]